MPQINLTYQQVLKQFKKESEEVIKLIKKGKSKDKDSEPSDFTWAISWAVSIKSENIKDLMRGVQVQQDPIENRINCVSLTAQKNKCHGATPISGIPKEILDWHQKCENNALKEKKDFESLSEKEQVATTEKVVKKLSKNGFFKFNLPDNKK